MLADPDDDEVPESPYSENSEMEVKHQSTEVDKEDGKSQQSTEEEEQDAKSKTVKATDNTSDGDSEDSSPKQQQNSSSSTCDKTEQQQSGDGEESQNSHNSGDQVNGQPSVAESEKDENPPNSALNTSVEVDPLMKTEVTVDRSIN